MKRLSQHAELLNLIENSGPFLAVSVLDKAFPQGLEKVDTPRRQRLRAAYEEWREAVDQDDGLLPELYQEWIRLVLTELLEFDHESLVQATNWVGKIPSVSSQEHFGRFQPDWIVRSPTDHKLRLFVAVLPPQTDLESVRQNDGWPVSLQERMTLLCRAHGVRLGLLTDGERWMLVNAPVGSISSQTSWYSRLWFQEPITLKAFQSLLGVRRCFGPAEDTLESLLDESLEHHEEVTDTLGEQVRRAVEVLVQCLDKADEDRNRELLRDVASAELYEAGLTVMMRLVFVLCAEERGLLLLGDPVYDQGYAVSTLRGQLTEDSERHGPEVLDRRHDAWARLLAVFRVVYGGIDHESLRMPALGGSLFDPDRFPFLEGRAKDTCWRDTSAIPLPIDNRTVLLLLNSLQILEQSGGALLLSYRALDVEQIGHVYEGLLEHTVARVPRVTLGLHGSQKAKNPNVALAELESARLDSEAAIVKLIQEVTARSELAIKNGLSSPVDDMVFCRVLGVCGGDIALAERIRPFTNLLRTDAWDDPIVYRDNSFMVTLGVDRRETGTYYTPKSLTESMIISALEPIVYIGSSETKSREKWILKSSQEILELKICDPSMGSGAFLVQACRYLSAKLVEAWLYEEEAGKSITVDGKALDQLGTEESLPSQLDERLVIARRLIAKRCLYGVDINPLAVELAKLSIWLVTLAKGRPFGFLDHNFRSGDSLLCIHQLEQLTRLRMDTKFDQQYQLRIFGQKVETDINKVIELRKRLLSTAIRDMKDIGAMFRLDSESREKLHSVKLIADAMFEEVLRCAGNSRKLDIALGMLTVMAGDYLNGNEKMGEQIALQAKTVSLANLPEGEAPPKRFHWVLEFPEVFCENGFDCLVTNPPYEVLTGFDKNPKRAEYATMLRECGYYKDALKGQINLYRCFIERALALLKNGGTMAMVTPMSLARDANAMPLRRRLICDHGAAFWSLYGEDAGLFSGVTQSLCVFKAVKDSGAVGEIVIRTSDRESRLPLPDLEKLSSGSFALPFLNSGETRLLNWLFDHARSRFADVADMCVGEVDQTFFRDCMRDEPTPFLLARGCHIKPFILDVTPTPGRWRFLDLSLFLAKKGRSAEAIQERAAQGRVVQLGIRNMQSRPRLVAALAPAGVYFGNSLNVYLPKTGLTLACLAGLLNSSLMDWLFRLSSANNNINLREIAVIPFPDAPDPTIAEQIDGAFKLCARAAETGDEILHTSRLVLDSAVSDYYGIPKDLRGYIR